MRIKWNNDEHEVGLIHEAFDGFECGLFLVGHEFGPTHLVTADSLADAEDAYLDQAETIPDADMWEAYGFKDKVTFEQWYTTPGGEDRDLTDGYRWQPNFTGTGIVHVGLYYWIERVHLHSLELTREERRGKSGHNGDVRPKDAATEGAAPG